MRRRVNAEGPTLDALVEKLPDIILDLLDEGDAAADHDIALEIVAHSHMANKIMKDAGYRMRFGQIDTG